MNQNNQPIIITEQVIVQSGETTDYTQISTGMGAKNQLNIFGIYCHVKTGGFDLSYITNNIGDLTFTDIQQVFVPSVRADDFVALPVCCDPRPGMGESLDLFMYRGRRALMRGNYIPLSIFNNAHTCADFDHNTPMLDRAAYTGKILIFHEPLAIYPTERLNIRVRNNNTADEDDDTYSFVTISLLGEIVDKDATLQIIRGEYVDEDMA